MTQELKIAMLGARGVGKTTLLTAMYDQFAETIGKSNLLLIPNPESSALLQECLGKLKSLIDHFEATGGIENTTSKRSFVFDVATKGGKTSIKLHFQDFPGEYLNSNATASEQKYVSDLLAESSVILIAIDTPALMEKSGKWHEEINRPQQITDLFQRVYQNIKSPKLVILAPVRCETYLQDSKSANLLLKNVKEKYTRLFNLFSYPALHPWVVSVVTPVQTMGNVVFSTVKEIDGQAHFYFRKTSHDAEYSPKDSDQPLRYILRFMLKLQIEDRNRNWGFYSPIRVWLGRDNDLKEAAMQASYACKLTDGFTVIQGENWLNIT